MVKVHLLWKKEEIEQEHIHSGKIAVIFDVLLATSVITTCLSNGAKEVIPVMDEKDARQVAKSYHPEGFCLVGEYNGRTIDGFLDPLPSRLNSHVAGKTVILSTTNGTVAIRKVQQAKSVYAASLLNATAVIQELLEDYRDETILVVCSGSRNRFCLEDFYGSGYFISKLIHLSDRTDIELTDSARAAELFYTNSQGESIDVLRQSRVGKTLHSYGLEDELMWVSQRDVLTVVPKWVEHAMKDSSVKSVKESKS